MTRFPCLCAVLVWVLGIAAARGAGPGDAGIAFFEARIRPVLAARCYRCHSAQARAAKKLKGGLLLDNPEGILKGGDSGPALVAGKPAASPLLKALRHDGELHMPPDSRLPEESIKDFEKWIALGVPVPHADPVVRRGIDLEAARRSWAFRPLAPAAPPAVRQAGWVRTPVDRFILARLEEKAIAPNPAAGREKLIRRASFDLWGLPPTSAEIDAFVNDTSPGAFDNLVDRLLEGPHYGERWARHWLDLARFAESGGYEFDGDRPGAYLYRDFVIKALNDDVPYDEFVRLQVAGDQLHPGDFLAATATGFLVAGPFPGQVTAKTRERIRYDHLDDMVATAGNALLALGLGCARCHDHKYDPVPQQDYYRFTACLARTDSSRTKLDPDPETTRQAKTAFDAAHAPLVESLARYEKEQMPALVRAWAGSEQAKPAPAWRILDPVSATGQTPLKKLDDGSLLATGPVPAGDTYTIVGHTYAKKVTAIRLEALPDALLPKSGPGRGANGDFTLASLTLTAAPLTGKGQPVPVKLRAASPGKNKKASWSSTGAAGRRQAAVFEVEGSIGFDGGTALTATLAFAAGGSIGRPRLAITSAVPPVGPEATAGFQHGPEILALLASQPGRLDDHNRAAVGRWFRKFDPKLDALAAAVERHALQGPKPRLLDGFVAGNVGNDAVYFLVRGEVDRKKDQAKPGFLQVLMRAPEQDARWTAGPAGRPAAVEPRVALARWLTDADAGAGHLLARVIVNRLWQHHLGRGIVATPNDFGAQGTPPTHPELLDYLAGELIRNGWRLKPIHKLIMTSAVYALDGASNEAALKADPDNRLYWRRPPRRLEAEVIRDSLLALSGALDPRMYGPGTLDENSLRRSVYLTVKRSQLVPMMQMFDAPEAIQSTGVRSTTTVATQSLALMNSPFVRRRAAELSRRIRPPSPGRVPSAVDDAYLAALGRRPTEAERQRMADFVRRQAASYAAAGRGLDHALTDFCQVLFCSNEFVYVD